MTGERLKIPISHKQQILDRFNPNNSYFDDGTYTINIPCSLCKIFRVRDVKPSQRCGKCPFEKFRKKDSPEGCMEWFQNRIKKRFICTVTTIWWTQKDDSIVEKQLRLLSQHFQEDVDWIEEEKNDFYVRCWIGCEPEERILMTLKEAEAEVTQLEVMHTDNIYDVECIDENWDGRK